MKKSTLKKLVIFILVIACVVGSVAAFAAGGKCPKCKKGNLVHHKDTRIYSEGATRTQHKYKVFEYDTCSNCTYKTSEKEVGSGWKSHNMKTTHYPIPTEHRDVVEHKCTTCGYSYNTSENWGY